MGDLILFCPCQLSWLLGWKVSWRPVLAVISLLASSFRYACILLLFVRITLKNIVLPALSEKCCFTCTLCGCGSSTTVCFVQFEVFGKLSEIWLVYQDQVICSCIFVCRSWHFSENNRVLSDDILSTGHPSYLQCMLYVESDIFSGLFNMLNWFFFLSEGTGRVWKFKR